MYKKIELNSIQKISIVQTNCKKSLQQIVQEQKCDYVINGGLYDMTSGRLCEIPLRVDGKTLATSSDGYWCLAWNTGADICMVHSSEMNKWKNAIACGTMLKGGTNTIFNYTSAQGGVRGRTGFGHDKTSLHLFVTTDKSGACSPTSLRTQMKNGGALNAIMLDSGGSSQGYFDGTYIQHEKRKVAYWICVWLKPQATYILENPYSVPTKTIYKTSEKAAIKWLQWELVNRGFLNNSDGKQIDGVLGNKTKTATKELQKSLGFTGLDVDGICGKNTMKKMGVIK